MSDGEMIQAAQHVATIGELAILVKRLSQALRRAAPDNDLPGKAMEYLHRKGLQGQLMRKVTK